VKLAARRNKLEEKKEEVCFEQDLSVISCVESPTKRLQVPMTTRSRKGSKQPMLGSSQVEESGVYHSALEEQEDRRDGNTIGTVEEEKSSRPKRQCAKIFESFLGVDSNSPAAGIIQNPKKGRKSKVIAAPKTMPALISSEEPGAPLATSTTSKQSKVLLTTMKDELYCTPSSRFVNIDYETPMEHKGVFSTVCDEQFVTPHEELPPKRSARSRKK